MKILSRQANLPQVVLARGAASRFAGGLHGWQEERDKDANNRDDDEQLNEREGGAALAARTMERHKNSRKATGLYLTAQAK
jgi:hypothetical protein